MTRRQKRNLGIFFIVLPFASIALALVGSVGVNVAVTQVATNSVSRPTGGDLPATVGNIIVFVYGVLGVIGIGGMITLLPLGIYMASKYGDS